MGLICGTGWEQVGQVKQVSKRWVRFGKGGSGWEKVGQVRKRWVRFGKGGSGWEKVGQFKQMEKIVNRKSEVQVF